MPDSRTYIITFDTADLTVDVAGLMAFVQSSDLFENWWNHIPAVFLVTSVHGAATLSDTIRQYTKDARLLVMEVNVEESEGWLPDQSWIWLRKRGKENSRQSEVA